MPDAVQAYVNTSQIVPSREIQRDVFALYESDIVKYVTDVTEARQIKMVYESIPAQLNTPAKRFKYARIQKNLRFSNLETAFDWLTSAGSALEATRVGDLGYPLGMHENRAAFKFFLNDIGLLTSRLMGTVDIGIINDRTNINYGSLYEAVVAQELNARGMSPHYYSSKRRGEVVFVIEDQATGEVTVIEVKTIVAIVRSRLFWMAARRRERSSCAMKMFAIQTIDCICPCMHPISCRGCDAIAGD